MRVAAFDLSLTSTGWAHSGRDGLPVGDYWASGVINCGASLRGVERLQYLLTRIIGIAQSADLVMLENYAFAAQNQAHQAGELGGVIRLGLYQRKIPFVVIAPNKLKKFATGVGKGKKEGVFAAAIRRLDYQGTSDDETDALWLLQMALHQYDLPGAIPLPANHLAALRGVDWPRIPGERR